MNRRLQTDSRLNFEAMVQDSLATKVEIGHVLSIGILGWMEMSVELQQSTYEHLMRSVRSSEDYVGSLESRELITVPSGDGMSLVFLGRAEAPARLAVHLWKLLANEEAFEIVMGLNIGPITRSRDISMKESASGGGINVARRALNLGGPKHILATQTAYDVLSEMPDWEGCFIDLGEYKVGDGRRMRVYNFAGDDFGNVASLSLEPSGETAAASIEAMPAAAAHRKVVLIYKRRVDLDLSVLDMLETRLRDIGHDVFIDRHLNVGVTWAEEIRAQIRASDAVIPLISESALPSEMLLSEVEFTCEFREKNGGRPQILPIRIGYTGDLPPTLGQYLDPIQYALWEDQKDDLKVIHQIQKALQRQESFTKTEGQESKESEDKPADQESANPLSNMVTNEPVGGAMPLSSKFYIVRKGDKVFCDAIENMDPIVLIKGARQMGKTSLLVRGLDLGRKKGWKIIWTDLQKLNENQLTSIDGLYKGLMDLIIRDAKLDCDVNQVWKRGRAPNLNFEDFLTKQVLQKADTHVIWAIDEADRFLLTPFATEVFGLFRSWYNERASNPFGDWVKLTQAITYATEAHLFIKDLNQSPFNVGTHVGLEDFSIAEVEKMNELYEKPLRTQAEIASLYGLVGGHPFLVRKSLFVMATTPMSLREFETDAERDDGPVGDHLKRILFLLSKDPELTDHLREVLRGKCCPDQKSYYRLRNAGVLLGDFTAPMIRCSLYERFLGRHLL